jgi:hypothetical protein
MHYMILMSEKMMSQKKLGKSNRCHITNPNTKFLLLTSNIASVEKGMHTNNFRYKKCTHFTVGTGNVYLNPGYGIVEHYKQSVLNASLHLHLVIVMQRCPLPLDVVIYAALSPFEGVTM